MSLRINDVAPDFTAESTEGTINFHQWIGDGWAVLFSHPKDFTPVCTTELGYMARIKPEFDKRNTKILGIFARLARRDNKPGYLRHLPRIWRYLATDLEHGGLSALRSWYDRHFPAESRARALQQG